MLIIGEEIEHLKDKIANLREDMNKIEDNIREEYREAWKDYKQHINSQIDEIQEEVNGLQNSFGNNQERIIKLESALDNLRVQMDKMESNILSYVQQNGASINDLSNEFRDIFKRVNVVEATSEAKDQQLENKNKQLENEINDEEKDKSEVHPLNNPNVWLYAVLIGMILFLAGYNLADFFS